MARSTVHYADNETNNILKRLHNKLRPAGTPVERVEYIIELLLLRIFETKLKHDESFTPLRKLFEGEENYKLLFSYLLSLNGDQILFELNKNIFPFYATILIKSRDVIRTNLSIKIYDQLILMEEVFANSNFTNNVKGGVIAEIIGLINEIEEKWILKTDLLGDAIESALSETGGTKDLGLYRTPDHIRKMMVEMVDPDFTDTIFDPACGTAGFLFNAYEYAIEKARATRQFPTESIANQFYRTGIGGIEYSGRIRKMAAVNLYIRGLNPHNIEQGDSLKMYDPSRDSNSKSIIISNPPFGAERDQPSYPDVWEEYSKESETTILFVKLMFNLLKQGGRCAVIVSEGFLTWGQNSACALRKILLNETNLKAIISLPQGVFVSKNGQGAKTSILYFEKSQPTDFVWYYKIENDGFSMGTNRKPIDGSLIPEMLELFKEVKKGNKPKDTEYSFCIPKEWIETIDPRLTIRIQNEVGEKFIGKNKTKRAKIVNKLNKKLSEDKISQTKYNERLWQFDTIVESQVENEIVKAIEKAHTYYLNLQNYQSNLNKDQIKEWKETLKDIKAINQLSIEKYYQETKTIDPERVLSIIASFHPENALHVDLVRDYMNKLDKSTLKQNKKFIKLFEIIKEINKYPLLPLSEFIIDLSEKRKIKIENNKLYYEPTISTKTNKISVNNECYGKDLKVKNRILIISGDLVIGRMHTQNGSYAIADREYVSTGTFIPFQINETKINPKYLIICLRKAFTTLAIEDVTGRETYKIDDILKIKIPIPPIEMQNKITEKIERKNQTIEGIEKVQSSFIIDFDIFKNFETKYIDEFAELNPVRNFINIHDNDFVSFVPMEAVNGEFGEIINAIEKKLSEVKKGYTYFKNDDVIFAKITPCMENGKSAIAKNLINGIGFGSTEFHVIRAKKEVAIPEYIYYLVRTKYFRDCAKEKMTGTSGHKRVPEGFLKNFKYPIPVIEVQKQIVKNLDRQMQALKDIVFLKEESEKNIQEILKEVWGEN